MLPTVPLPVVVHAARRHLFARRDDGARADAPLPRRRGASGAGLAGRLGAALAARHAVGPVVDSRAKVALRAGDMVSGVLAAGTPDTPGFDLLVLLHVVCVLVGIGTVLATGVQAARVAARRGGELPPSLRRYFTPGTNWAARVIYGIPVFGFALLAASRGAYGLDDGWVMGGLALWVAVAAVGEGVLWPAERRIQAMVAAGRRPEDEKRREDDRGGHEIENGREPAAGAGPAGPTANGGAPTLAATCRRASSSAGLMLALLVAAIVIMFVRP